MSRFSAPPSAAPLKPFRPGGLHSCREWIFRAPKRGPIEAIKPVLLTRLTVMIFRAPKRGPIEAFLDLMG